MYVGKVKGKEAKRRNLIWFARDRAASICEYFATEKEATEFAEDFNSDRRRRSHNLQPTNKALKKWSAQLLVRSYMFSKDRMLTETDEAYEDKDELVESCELQNNLAQVLWNFSCDSICNKSLFDFTPQIAERYIEDQLKATYISNGSDVEKKYSPDTVRRNVTAIQNAWKWGRKTFPELSHLENPWKGLQVPGTGGKRQRGLRKGELEKLIAHCEECRGTNRYYLPLAIELAVDTGMRRQEIFNLTWRDINFRERTINIRKDKNSWRRPAGDEARKICLPPMSQFLLMQLAVCLKEEARLPGKERIQIPKQFHPPNGVVFMNTEREPMTGNGFKQAFEEVRDRAGIVDLEPRKRLTPHSLRAAAEMAFRRAGLNDKEIDVMKNGIKSHYDVLDDFLELIQKKLDIALLGKPLAEIEREQAEHQREFDGFYEEGLKEGLDREAAMERAASRMLERYPKYSEIKDALAELPSRQARLAEEVT